jgi:hypothetical protein
MCNGLHLNNFPDIKYLRYFNFILIVNFYNLRIISSYKLKTIVMKKLSIILIIFCISFVSYAQDGDGLDNRFYLRGGFSNPTDSYLGYKNTPFPELISSKGWVFELGSIFMLNNLDLGDGLRLGINVDYAEITYHKFSYEDGFEYVDLYMGQVSSKVGPSLSFSPVHRLVFDGFFKLKIPWVAFGYFDAPDDPELHESYYLGAIDVGFSTGINIRYGVLMLGFDYSSNNMKMNSDEDSEEYLGNFLDPSDTGEKTKIAYMNFTIGVNF